MKLTMMMNLTLNEFKIQLQYNITPAIYSNSINYQDGEVEKIWLSRA